MADVYDIEKKTAELTELVGKQAKSAQELAKNYTDAQLKSVQETMAAELKAASEQIKELQGELMKSRVQETAETPEFKSLNAGLRGFFKQFTHQEMTPSEAKGLQELETKAAMAATNGPRAGFIKLPATVASGILNTNFVEYSPVRSVARVVSITGSEYEQSTKTAHITAGWTAEAGTRSASTTHTYGQEVIPVHEMYAYDSATRRMLDMAEYDIASDMQVSGAMQFAALEGAAFVTGNGAGKPSGIMANATVLANYVAQGEAATITNGDAIRKLWLKPKSGYRGNIVYGMNATTLAAIYSLKGGDGQYIFQMMANAPLGTIQGKRIIEMTDMADIGAGAYPIVAGDFGVGYTIVDRMADWGILVDPYSQKTAGAVEYMFTRYVGGGVVVPEAFAVLKVAAS